MTDKNRFRPAKSKVETMISYSKGLLAYYGMIPFALEAGVFEKVTADKTFVPHLDKEMKNLEIYSRKVAPTVFTDDVMNRIDEYTKSVYSFSSEFDIEDAIIDTDILEDMDNDSIMTEK